jgi:hypothetical protein
MSNLAGPPEDQTAEVSSGRRVAFNFEVGEHFPALVKRLKKRYMTELLKSRTWTGGYREVSSVCGLSAPTVKALCAELDIKVPF